MKIVIVGMRSFVAAHLSFRTGEEGVEVVRMKTSDLLAGESGESDVAGADCLVYLSQSSQYRNVPEKLQEVYQVNLLGAIRAAEMAKRKGVGRFVYASTGSVYAPGFSPLAEDSPVRRDEWYPLSKLHAEEALALYRRYMDVIILRPFGVYGPGQRDRLVPNLIEAVREGKPVYLQKHPVREGDRDGLRISLCHVDDAADILFRLSREGGPAVLNLAGDRPFSIRELAVAIGELVGREPVFRFAEESRRGDLIADISLLRKTFQPAFKPFREGLAETVRRT
jgi:nucleoside-diphosphate-sugar epimerase